VTTKVILPLASVPEVVTVGVSFAAPPLLGLDRRVAYPDLVEALRSAMLRRDVLNRIPTPFFSLHKPQTKAMHNIATTTNTFLPEIFCPMDAPSQ
jgi:hypothetical protein